ncbi:translocation/assembly module TamB [Paraglaciecola sp. Hal342]
MKILKYCAIFIGSLLVLLALTASPWGTRGVLLLADSSLDELDIDYGSGSLLSQLTLNRVAYVTPDMSLKVGKLAVDVNWSCVATMQACLTALSAQSVAVQLSSSEEQSPPSNEPLERITLPIPVSVDALDIRNIRVDVANTLEMKINSVSSEVSMFRTLNIEHLTLSGTRIILPNEPTEAPDKDGSALDIQAIANWHYTPIKLPPIVFPIVMRANNVAVDDLLISQGKEPVFDISALRAAIDITPKLLTVKKLQVSSSLGEAELTASVNKQWRHQLKMQLKSAQDSTYPIDAQLNLKGNLQRSELNLTTSGVLDLAANASVDLQSAQLPLSLEVNWQPVDWPPEQANIQLEKGQLSVSGNLNQYQLALDTALKGQSVPHTLVAMRAEGNNRQANIKHITLDTLGGRVQATAKVTIDTLLKWQSHIEFNNIQPQQFWPELEANVEGNVDIDGQYDGQIVRAHMRELSASGDWLDYQLNASGEAKFNSQEGIEVPELLVKTGDNQVTMTGTLEAFDDVQAQLSLDAQDLSQLYPTFAGKAQLNAQIDGTLTAPEIDFDGLADKLTLPDMRISQLATKGQVIWDEDKQAKVELQLSNAMIAQQNIANLNVALNGDAQEHQISLSLNSDVANVVTKLHGSLAQSQWDGVLDVATIALDAGQFSLEQQEPSIHANWAKNEYRLSPFCLSDDEASVCIKQAEYLASTAQFDIAINELPLSPVLSANLPQLQGVDTDAKLNLLAKGQWNIKELPIIEADISLTPSVWTVEGAATPLELDALNVKVNTITQKNTSSQRITSKLTLESKELGAIRSDVSLQVNGDEKPISGQLTLDTITLGAAAQFVPQLTELAGIVDGTVDISGSLTTPLIKGEVKLHDGAVAGSMLPSRVNQVEQRINFTGQAATLTGSFQLGNGKGQVDGEFDWQDTPSAVVNVKGSEMEIDYQNMVRAKLSPDVNVEFGAAGLSVKGEVTLPYARIRVRELPPSAISPSSDVVLVNDQQAVVEDEMPLKLSLQVNIDPKKNNDVKVDAFGLTSDLQGSLLLTQDGEVLNANGELNLVNGRYKAYGQDLVIREGEIQFSGPIDSPYLVVEAVRDPDKTADDVIAGLRIQGSASQPQVSVFSDPSMDQPEALSYLLRGTAINSEDETSSDAALASALIGFGLGKSENKVTNIGRKIGVEDLALNTSGAGDETKLSVSGYIAPGVQIRYGVGVFDSVSEVALRYQLIPKLYLEAVSSLNSELNLYYQFSLDDEEDTKPE